jgi:hypothetical protein
MMSDRRSRRGGKVNLTVSRLSRSARKRRSRAATVRSTLVAQMTHTSTGTAVGNPTTGTRPSSITCSNRACIASESVPISSSRIVP